MNTLTINTNELTEDKAKILKLFSQMKQNSPEQILFFTLSSVFAKKDLPDENAQAVIDRMNSILDDCQIEQIIEAHKRLLYMKEHKPASLKEESEPEYNKMVDGAISILEDYIKAT